MDTPHCAALPARLPSLMPRPHAALRPPRPAPLRLLAALQGEPSLHARATAWGWPRRGWGLAALAVLVLGGAWVGLASPAAGARPARTPAPARRLPGPAGSAAAHKVDPDAALLKAVMDWHERNPAASASARQRQSELMP